MTVFDVMEENPVESFKNVSMMLDIEHASQNLKMVDKMDKNIFTINICSIGGRVARGCATKRPMLYVECEAHKSKSVLEEFCYCSFDLCNGAATNNFSVSYVLMSSLFIGVQLLGRL